MDAADEENLEATVVAEVSKDPRLVMYWRGEKSSIFRVLPRYEWDFPKADVEVEAITAPSPFNEIPEQVQGLSSIKDRWLRNLDRLNVCSQEGWGNVLMGPSDVGLSSCLLAVSVN